jgi:hypothetical protein
MKCVADPSKAFTGRFFYLREFERSIEKGVLPSGSLWLNDHSEKVFEVLGVEGERQQMVIVGRKRLKLLGSRFPMMKRRTLS